MIAQAVISGKLFEVFKDETDQGFPYAGYVDGKRSVSASAPDVCFRALEKKHSAKDRVIEFSAAKDRLRPSRES